MPAASRLRRRGQAWFEHAGLARVRQLEYLGERPACGQGWAGMVPTGSQLAGSPCRCGRLGDLWLRGCGP